MKTFEPVGFFELFFLKIFDYKIWKFKGTESNFNKYPNTSVGLLYMPYDYDSVMHYSRTAFSINGNPTIVPKVPGAVIGQRAGLSFQDKLEIIEVYGSGKK